MKKGRVIISVTLILMILLASCAFQDRVQKPPALNPVEENLTEETFPETESETKSIVPCGNCKP